MKKEIGLTKCNNCEAIMTTIKEIRNHNCMPKTLKEEIIEILEDKAELYYSAPKVADPILAKFLEILPKEMRGRFEDDFVAGEKQQGYFRNGFNQCLKEIKSLLTNQKKK